MQAMAENAQQQAQHFSQATMIEKTFSVLQTLSLSTQSNPTTTIAKVNH
jgi:hypothetical protein